MQRIRVLPISTIQLSVDDSSGADIRYAAPEIIARFQRLYNDTLRNKNEAESWSRECGSKSN